jgi:CRE-PMP-2 protein
VLLSNISFFLSFFSLDFATVVGYLSLAAPFITGQLQSKSDRLKVYYNSGKMMLKLADSIDRLGSAGRDFSRLSGYTQRICTLMKCIDENQNLSSHKRYYQTFGHITGKVELCDINDPKIVLIDVPLYTPSGEVLVESLSFSIRQGQNVIITG